MLAARWVLERDGGREAGRERQRKKKEDLVDLLRAIESLTHVIATLYMAHRNAFAAPRKSPSRNKA